MTRNKSENKIIGIKPEFESVLVCNDRRLNPYIEIIIQEAENITSQNLGTLIGVLEVTDDSEDSSYIVNYLISIIKKEYFSRPKRGPIESLESALHKANLALSGLVEHGNINWLGKLNALVAVTEKNNLHLSQTGTAEAFLLRSKILTNVSEGLAPAEIEPNPLKTFVSVSSGRLESSDKLIITTASIFDIFSLEEIKKSALRFSNEEFVQFLRTALGNELQKAAVLIADLKDQEKIIEKVVQKTTKEKNVFSSDAFVSKAKNRQEKIAGEIQAEIQAAPQEFTDEKTGHIYIKEELRAPIQENNGQDYLKIIFEKISDLSKNLGRAFLSLPWNRIKNLHLPKLPNLGINLDKFKGLVDSQSKIKNTNQKLTEKNSAPSTILKDASAKIIDSAKVLFSQKNQETALKLGRNIYHKSLSGLLLIMPSLKKIKKNISQMDHQQKLYALLAIVLILVVPLIGIKIKNNFNNTKPSPTITENPPEIVPLTQDKNVARLGSLDQVYSGTAVLKILNLNEKMFAVTATEIVDLEKNKAFPIPPDFSAPKNITGMQDLNLIFLMNAGNAIVAFSPISGNFQTNNLAVPSGSDIRAIGTYLTYIYLVDAANNQIYRYPRAEGGFGAATNWLKDSINFSDTVDIALGENIFIANKGNIFKLFRGQTQDFALEETATPISITAIALGKQSGNLFILDKQNSRVIQLDADGKIITQYYNPEISSAVSLTVNENTKTLSIASENSIKTLPIN